MTPISHLRLGPTTLEVASWAPPAQAERLGPTVVLLHEGLGCVAMWKHFGSRLAERLGLRVVAYSRAGYGGSDTIDLPRPLDYMLSEADHTLPRLLDRLCPGPRLLLGHSDGATIALAYAGVHHDPLLAGIIAIAPHVIVEEMTLTAIRRAKADFVHGDLAKKLARYHGSNLTTAFWGWNDVWLDPGFRTFSILDRLPDIKVPILALQGDADPYGSRAQLELIAAQCEQVDIAYIQGAGHAPHLSDPEEVLARIGNFVAPTTSTDSGEHRC